MRPAAQGHVPVQFFHVSRSQIVKWLFGQALQNDVTAQGMLCAWHSTRGLGYEDVSYEIPLRAGEAKLGKSTFLLPDSGRLSHQLCLPVSRATEGESTILGGE